MLAGTGGILVHSGIKRHTISKRKNNEKEIESVETEVKEKSEVTKTMSKSLVKETKLDNNKDTSKDHSMQSFLAPSVDKCTFVVYEADGVNVMKTNGKEMIYRITGDTEYEACLKNEIGNFLVSSDSKSCKIDVFGPDAKKNSEGKLVGESFEFHAYDYRTQFKKFIDYVGGISKSLRAEEEDVMLKAA